MNGRTAKILNRAAGKQARPDDKPFIRRRGVHKMPVMLIPSTQRRKVFKRQWRSLTAKGRAAMRRLLRRS
jgi:hypothetical protein